MTRKPFELGVMTWLDQSLSKALELAVGAEEAGLAEAWVADHYFLRDAFVSMAMMAERTKRIRLGTAVAAVQLRHPALLASSAATVDELSNGRVILGIGPGGYEFPAHLGMKVKSPLTMMRESVTIIRSLLRGPTDLKGTYFSATGAKLTWKPQPVPLQIAARGPAMTELAGEIADGVLIHGINQKYLDFVKERLQVGAARAGRTLDDCEIGAIIDVEWDDKDPAAAVNRLRPRLRVIAGGVWSESMIPYYQLDPTAVGKLKAAVSAGDPNAPAFVTDEMVHVFGIAGTREHVKNGLIRLRESGLRRVVLKFLQSPEEAMKRIQELKPIIAEVCA